MVAYVYLLSGVHDRLRRVVRHGRPRHRAGQADGADRRAARLREAAGPHPVESGQRRRRRKAAIFSWAIGAGVSGGRGRCCAAGSAGAAAIAGRRGSRDRLVFATVREALGGRLRYLVSGSAPLGADVAEFFCAHRPADPRRLRPDRDGAVLTVNPPDAPRVGTVGPQPAGRRAPHRRRRRDPRARAEHHDRATTTSRRRPPRSLRDGWFHTGDIGAHRRGRLPARSPIARRICSSPPAARRSRRSRSRRRSSAARSSPKPWSSAIAASSSRR